MAGAGGSVPSVPGGFGGGTYSGGAGGAAGDIYNTTSNSSGFNSSGWNVNFGSGSIDSGSNKAVMYGLLAIGALLAWRYFRGGRRGR